MGDRLPVCDTGVSWKERIVMSPGSAKKAAVGLATLSAVAAVVVSGVTSPHVVAPAEAAPFADVALHPVHFGHGPAPQYDAAPRELKLADFNDQIDILGREGNFAGESAAPRANVPTTTRNEVEQRLRDFQNIADNHRGNRAHGTSGHKATVDYLQNILDNAGFETTVQPFNHQGKTGYNLLAELPIGDPNNVLMFGAHTDSVTAGAGINDNASGSTGVLQAALAFKESGLSSQRRVRFAWWGAEEIGLAGSRHYVSSLTAQERRRIKGYYNFDMIASPNPGYFVYDGDDENGWVPRSVNNRIPEIGQGHLEDVLENYFASINVETREVQAGGRSDHSAFLNAGIPVGGLFTGLSSRRSAEAVRLWGGREGVKYDPCYHKRCDNINNISYEAMVRNTNAIISALWTVAIVGNGEPTPGRPTEIPTNQPTTNPTTPGVPVTPTTNPVTPTSGPVTPTSGPTTAPTTPAPQRCGAVDQADVAINDRQTVRRQLTISECGLTSVTKAQVNVDIKHTYRGDLIVRLKSPEGRTYRLFNRQGGGADDLKQTFDVSLRSGAANGDWTLEVQDVARNDTGTLVSWSIDVKQ